MSALRLDPYDHDFHWDPYPLYKALRDTDPVHYNDKLDLWFLTRWDGRPRVLVLGCRQRGVDDRRRLLRGGSRTVFARPAVARDAGSRHRRRLERRRLLSWEGAPRFRIPALPHPALRAPSPVKAGDLVPEGEGLNRFPSPSGRGAKGEGAFLIKMPPASPGAVLAGSDALRFKNISFKMFIALADCGPDASRPERGRT